MGQIAEIDTRLKSHEAECQQRWRENYRRLESIETQLTTLNSQIRISLVFLVVTLGSFFFVSLAL
jgi:hypothetical protein